MSLLSATRIIYCWDRGGSAAAAAWGAGARQCLTNKELGNITSDYTGLHGITLKRNTNSLNYGEATTS